MKDFKYLIGKRLEIVKQEIPPPFFIFVADQDGRSFYKTFEYNQNRINVSIVGGVIIKVYENG